MSNLLTFHIFVGVIALTSALISVFTKKGKELGSQGIATNDKKKELNCSCGGFK